MHARRPGGTYAATAGNNALQDAVEMTRTIQGCKADNEFACGGGCQTRQEMWVSAAVMQWENFSTAAQSGDVEGCGGGGRAVARLGRWWAHDWEEEMERLGEWMAYGPHADRRGLWTVCTSPQNHSQIWGQDGRPWSVGEPRTTVGGGGRLDAVLGQAVSMWTKTDTWQRFGGLSWRCSNLLDY
jgi:hypothetical protein